ncbi:MAG: DUF2569 family protein, partial [Bacteroidales bacterium]|nr:DUF2569 family protein [Bacteroidales bacterium]
KISGDGFVYEKSIIGKGKKLEAKHNYELNKSYISSDSAEKFLKQHEDIQQQLTYQLTYTPTSTTTAKYSWVSIFLVLITLGFSFGLGRRIYKNYNPKPIKNAENLNIGGWMVLPAIGLVISPFLVAYQVFTNNYFDQVSWDVIRASGDYNSANFAILYGGELVYNVLVFSFAIFLAVLFFQRRSSLPFLISIYYAFVLVGLLVDTIALQMVAPDLLSSDDILASIKELSKTFIAAAIWIPYFNISTRVKNTFCKTLNENGKLIEPTAEAIEE